MTKNVFFFFILVIVIINSIISKPNGTKISKPSDISSKKNNTNTKTSKPKNSSNIINKSIQNNPNQNKPTTNKPTTNKPTPNKPKSIDTPKKSNIVPPEKAKSETKNSPDTKSKENKENVIKEKPKDIPNIKDKEKEKKEKPKETSEKEKNENLKNPKTNTTNNEPVINPLYTKSLKLHSKLLHTVYSDSFSKNYYYTTLYIGQDRIKQTYVIDTGSAIMSSPCAPCPECGPNKTHYFFNNNTKDAKKSILKCGSKFCDMVPASNCMDSDDKVDKKKYCSFDVKQESGDGIKGYYLKDIAYFEVDKKIIHPLQKRNFRSYALPVGCTTGEYGKYKNLQADGVMGLNKEKDSFINLLYNLKIINNNLFSLCFGVGGGYMSLGEIDKTYHKNKKIKYVPMLTSKFLYLIKINGIAIEHNNKTINAKLPASIDTGNSISYFPPKIYDALIEEFEKYCQGGCGVFKHVPDLGYCATFFNREILFMTVRTHWPNITLYLENGTHYTWKPIHYYYYDLHYSFRKACLGINKHKSQNIILGNNFLQGHDVIFDLEKNKLGLVRADCSRGNLLLHRLNPYIDFYRNPIFIDKEIHKGEEIGKFALGDNNQNNQMEFILGHNTELDEKTNFETVNFVILICSIGIVVVVLIIVIYSLTCSKRIHYDEDNFNAVENLENMDNDTGFRKVNVIK